jgi:putative ABC transport system ATP-binding protein
MTLLLVEDVSKVVPLRRRGPLTVLDRVNLEVQRGESLAVLGRSGSGKSTLLSILGLLDEPTTGRYLIEGRDTATLGSAPRARLRGTVFGFVYQRFCLMNHLTAAENVEAAGVHRGEPRRTRRARAADLLDQVGLADRRNHRPGQLSGGEQQRVAIARALAWRPTVLLADEPTGSLDEDTGAVVLALLRRLGTEHGATLIVVTHDPVVAEACSHTVQLAHGQVVTR